MQGWFTRVSCVFHFSLLHVTTYLEMTYHRIQKSERNTGRTKTKYKERKVKDAKIQIKKTKCVNCLRYWQF